MSSCRSQNEHRKRMRKQTKDDREQIQFKLQSISARKAPATSTSTRSRQEMTATANQSIQRQQGVTRMPTIIERTNWMTLNTIGATCAAQLPHENRPEDNEEGQPVLMNALHDKQAVIRAATALRGSAHHQHLTSSHIARYFACFCTSEGAVPASLCPWYASQMPKPAPAMPAHAMTRFSIAKP